MPRLIRGITVGVLIAVVAGCSSAELDRQVVSSRLRAEISTLAEDPSLGAVPDLRQLREPSVEVQEHFERRAMVYRVIDASRDAALIAVWRRDAPEPEPFNRNRVAVGSTCARLERAAALRAQAVNCPHELAREFPDQAAPTWGRDAESRQAVEAVRAELDFALWWVLARNSDGTQPRSETRGIHHVEAALAKVARDRSDGPERATLDVVDLTQDAAVARGRVRVVASAPDVTQVGAMTTSQGCFTFELDLEAKPVDRQTRWPMQKTVC